MFTNGSGSDRKGLLTEADIISILVATDNHLGYAENDIRGEDSMVTFREILELAKDKDVDFILLGGDLFHDSKPSLKCLRDCMALLRKYCMGDKPISVEFLSDQNENFKHCEEFPLVNYEDPNLNISIPVFSIHGNHDDPSGYNQMSSMDILSATGLINYFGRWSNLNYVEISPLLMQKGRTKIALYGLSYIRDDRLARLCKNNKVSVGRPSECVDDWFNIFVCHQNRADRGIYNFLAEEYIPDFMNIVIWGHEHECRIDPEYNCDRGFRVTQPGSSVATSLCEGESKMKYVTLLHVQGDDFRFEKQRLKTVRPFVFDSIILPPTMTNPKNVESYLVEKVENAIKMATRQLTGHPNQPTIPLIRIRVEFTEDAQRINVNRFGQRFQDKVANFSDILLLRKKLKKRCTIVDGGDNFDGGALEEFLQSIDLNEDWEDKMKLIINSYFEDKASLDVLSIKGLSEGVAKYIEHKNANALDDIIDMQMKRTKEYLLSTIKKKLSPEELDQELMNFRVARMKKPEDEENELRQLMNKSKDPLNDENIGNLETQRIDDVMANDDEEDVPATVKTSRGRGRGRGITSRARGTRARARGNRGRGTGRGQVIPANPNNFYQSDSD